jgi:hypothetical protein
MEHSLSDSEVKELAGPGTRIFSYPQLSKITHLSQLVNDQYPKAVILYQTQSNGNSVYGHWTALSKLKDGSIQFFDSYGTFPDDQQKHIGNGYLQQSNQVKNKIKQLLLAGGPINNMHYNEHKYQQLKNNINTCGRHAGFFLKSGLSTDQYYELMETIRKATKMSYDKLIVMLTDGLF